MKSSHVIFKVEDLWVSVEDKKILQGVNLTIHAGEVHALMGRNGSGKTTLAHTLMGHPKYRVDCGRILLDGEDVTHLAPEERAKKRLFIGFQHPISIPGVVVGNFLRASLKAVRGSEIPPAEVRKLIRREAEALGVADAFLSRFLNDGFSGGEKKRLETLQMRLLQPKVAVLDETDSGLDIDALKTIAEGIDQMRSPSRAILLITHYQRMLNYIRPDFVHVLADGKIIKSGDASLAHQLEEKGYDWLVSPATL